MSSIDTEAKTVRLAQIGEIAYGKLLVATGSQSNRFGWPGQNLRGVQGFYSYQDLQLLEENSRGIRRGVNVGGGLIGIEVAEMLQSRGIAVTLLVREENFWDIILPREEAEMIGRHIRRHHIDLSLSTELKKFADIP